MYKKSLLNCLMAAIIMVPRVVFAGECSSLNLCAIKKDIQSCLIKNIDRAHLLEALVKRVPVDILIGWVDEVIACQPTGAAKLAKTRLAAMRVVPQALEKVAPKGLIVPQAKRLKEVELEQERAKEVVEKGIATVIFLKTGIDRKKITGNSTFMELGVDQCILLEILMKLESIMKNIEISYDDACKMVVVGDLAEYIMRKSFGDKYIGKAKNNTPANIAAVENAVEVKKNVVSEVIEYHVIDTIFRKTGVDKKGITVDSVLQELGIDEPTFLELLMYLEDLLGIEIKSVDAYKMVRAGDIVNYIMNYLHDNPEKALTIMV